MAATNQGVQVIIETRPEFTGFLNINTSDTKKFRLTEDLEDSTGVQVAGVRNDLQTEMSASLVLKAGTTLPEPGEVLTASPGSVKWEIIERGRPYKAGLSRSVDLKLKNYSGMTLS